MMDDLYYRLLHLGFSRADFELRDDGLGPYIAKWNNESPQPNLASLEAVSKEQVEAAQERGAAKSVFREAAVDKLLEEAAKSPTAPREIKDYVETRKAR